MLLSILEVVVHDIVWIKAVLSSNFRLLCVVKYQELIRAILLSKVNACW